MSDDIVERLRKRRYMDPGWGVPPECAEAADEIERLRKEVKLRKSFMDRLPFCPDHRDKQAGLSCRACEIERLRAEVAECRENCPGGRVYGVRSWVAEERLIASEAEVARLREALREIAVWPRNDPWGADLALGSVSDIARRALQEAEDSR